MSIDMSIFLGPYLKIITHTIESIKPAGCSREGCPMTGTDSPEYCPQCGQSRSHVRERPITKPAVDIHDIVTDDNTWVVNFREDLCIVALRPQDSRSEHGNEGLETINAKDTFFLTDNRFSSDYVDWHLWQRSAPCVGDLTNVDIPAQIEAFKKRHAEEIERIKQMVDQVEVGFGLLLYYS